MNRFSRFLPPGTGIREIKNYFLIVIVMSVLTSMGFLIEYFNAVREIRLELIRAERMETGYLGKMLPAFAELMDGKLTLFWLSAIGFLVFVFFNYRYFWQESKSIYVMRRLKSRWEMHKRCWTLPLLGAAIIVLTAAVIYWLYCGIYFWCAPEGFIPAQEILLGWRYVQ